MNDLTIPDFLRIDADTRKKAWVGHKLTSWGSDNRRKTAEVAKTLKAHKLRKLRAEERRLSKTIDALGNNHNSERRKLYALIAEVEKQIASLC